ncbi:MAG TPA: TRAP transporter small permease [Alphaproteobacteria bacterium]|jgi:TRAP-type mannitol/chloroaromatic compound transport system permease small subunit|nr:TRAP transporter small permease [Alphaproteobacteria bacterium]
MSAGGAEGPPVSGGALGESAPRPSVAGGSWFGAITMGLNVIGTVLIILMALAVNLDVLGRDLFNSPVPGVTEFIGASIVSVVFLQMANTLREERHVSNDIILAAIGVTRPRIACAFYALFHAVGAALMGLIVWYVWPMLVENYQGGYYRGTAGVVEIPVWPFMLTVVVGGAATLIQYLLLALRELRRALAAPVGRSS